MKFTDKLFLNFMIAPILWVSLKNGSLSGFETTILIFLANIYWTLEDLSRKVKNR